MRKNYCANKITRKVTLNSQDCRAEPHSVRHFFAKVTMVVEHVIQYYPTRWDKWVSVDFW